MIAIILVATFVVMVPNISAGIAMQKNGNNFNSSKSQLFLYILVFIILKSVPANLIGPYTLAWSTFELCKGPKAKNLSEVGANIQNQGGDYYGRMNFTFLVPSRIDELKIVVSTIKDNVKSVLWAYNLKDPCQHFLFASIIEKHLNAHNCAVEKGNYFAEVNFSEMTKSFLGSSFFYGDYIMKATAVSKKGNILCLTTNMAVEKKGKEAA